MKIKNLALLCMLLASPALAHADYDYRGEQCHLLDHEEDSLTGAYAASIIPGMIIGGIGGALCSVVEKKHPDVWPLTWIVEMCERETMVEILSTDLKKKHIYHHKRLMELSAWISSWIAYVYLNQ